MDRREGDAAGNLNIWSSCGAAEYSLIFQTVLPGGRVQFGFSNCPAGRPSPIDKPAEADRSGDRTVKLILKAFNSMIRSSHFDIIVAEFHNLLDEQSGDPSLAVVQANKVYFLFKASPS